MRKGLAGPPASGHVVAWGVVDAEGNKIEQRPVQYHSEEDDVSAGALEFGLIAFVVFVCWLASAAC